MNKAFAKIVQVFRSNVAIRSFLNTSQRDVREIKNVLMFADILFHCLVLDAFDAVYGTWSRVLVTTRDFSSGSSPLGQAQV